MGGWSGFPFPRMTARLHVRVSDCFYYSTTACICPTAPFTRLPDWAPRPDCPTAGCNPPWLPTMDWLCEMDCRTAPYARLSFNSPDCCVCLTARVPVQARVRRLCPTGGDGPTARLLLVSLEPAVFFSTFIFQRAAYPTAVVARLPDSGGLAWPQFAPSWGPSAAPVATVRGAAARLK